jgi:hypothetical protein
MIEREGHESINVDLTLKYSGFIDDSVSVLAGLNVLLQFSDDSRRKKL